MKERGNYIHINFILILVLWCSIAVMFYSLFTENAVFDVKTKILVITGLVFLLICIKKNIGGPLFEIFTIFLFLYYIQRIVLLAINPDYFAFKLSITMDKADVNGSLLYLLVAIVAILLGYSFGGNMAGRSRSKDLNIVNDAVLSKNIYRKIWIVISLLLLFVKVFILLYLRQGFGVVPPSYYAWVLRPLEFLAMILMVNIVLSLQNDIKLSKVEERWLKWFIFIYLLVLIISGSRAALLSILMYVFSLKFLLDRRISIKQLIVIMCIFLMSLASFPIVNIYRGYLQEKYIVQSADNSYYDYSGYYDRFNVIDSINFLSERMNGFDLLVASIAKKDILSTYFDVKVALLQCLDTLYPGSLFVQEYSPGEIIPMVLRNFNMSDFLFHREHMNLIGMSQIYFGYIGGIFFLFILCLVTAFVIFSTNSIFIKLLFIQLFIIYPFENGFIEGIFQLFSMNAAMYSVFIVIAFLVANAVHSNKNFNNDSTAKPPSNFG